jgi:hypothetical protein
MTGKSLSLPIKIPTKGFCIKTPLPLILLLFPLEKGDGEWKSEIRISKFEKFKLPKF